MPEDVRQALDRFQNFLGKHRSDAVIDQASGFTVSDGMLLAGEIELNAHETAPGKELFPDDSL